MQLKIDKIKEEINRMMTMGVIEKSSSPWLSPIVGIEKKWEYTSVLDARKIINELYQIENNQ
jgi:hypothetical protein